MKTQTMVIQELTYENIDIVKYHHRVFPEGIALLDHQDDGFTVAVLRVILGDRNACDFCMGENSRIFAKLEIGGKTCTMEVTQKNGEVHVKLQGAPVQYAVMELQNRLWDSLGLRMFFGDDGYATQLQEIVNGKKTPAAFCKTEPFRKYIQQYIRSFRPEKLLPGKNLWLCLGKDGRFLVRQEKSGEEVLCLSETDLWAFRFLCFVHLRRFWDTAQRKCNIPGVLFPAMTWDFSRVLDRSVDFEALLRRELESGRQLFL